MLQYQPKPTYPSLSLQNSEILHPWVDGCHATAFDRFTKVFKSFVPVYGTLHFVPMLLLRSQHFKRE